MVHAVNEASRLDLRLAMNACDGWALAGGPWITPAMSMQEIVTTEQIISGGKTFKGKLVRPTTRNDYYRDIAVLAYPALEGAEITSTLLSPRATTKQYIFQKRDGSSTNLTNHLHAGQLSCPPISDTISCIA